MLRHGAALDLTRHPRPPPAPPVGAIDPACPLPVRGALAPDGPLLSGAFEAVAWPCAAVMDDAVTARKGQPAPPRPSDGHRQTSVLTAVGWVTSQGELARRRVATWCWWECGVGWGQLPAPPTPATYQALPVPAAPLQIPRSPQRPSPLRFALLLLAPLPPSSPRSRPQLPLHPYQPWHHQDPRVPYLWRIDMIPTSPTIPLAASTQV